MQTSHINICSSERKMAFPIIMISFLYSLLFCLIMRFGVASTHHLCHTNDVVSLLQFKKDMYSINESYSASRCTYFGQPSYPKMISWNKTSSDCCTWEGVKCHQNTSHVIGLDLSCSRLRGVIHHNSTLFYLSHLIKLNLAYNAFDGSPISTFENIGRLSSLTHLNLSSSYFEGVIPLQLSYLSKLVLVDLSRNFLGVNIANLEILLRNLTSIKVLSLGGVQISAINSPTNLSSSSLTYLNLEYTGIDGKKISNSIFHFPILKTLMLRGNEYLSVGQDDMQKSNCLVKGVPNFVCSFASLKMLDLSYCGLSSSSIAKSIGNLSQIIQFYFFGNNSTTHSLPAFMISNLPKLRELDLGYNSFTGQFPSFMGNLTELTFLSLERNFLRGPLPSNISGLKKLRDLRLSYNKFDGTIPAWLFSISSLMGLSLQDNCFTGGIKEFASSSIERIDFGDNKLNGKIPNSIFQLVNLKYLHLQSNNFIGSIEFSLFSHLKSLLHLDISNNKLSLKVGNEANVSFPNLSSLALSSCRITKFPNFLKNTKNLVRLDLSNNRLHGEIPKGVLQDNLFSLNLSQNSLSKSLNINFALMKNLLLLDLSSNQFQEPLPLSICNHEQLFFLDLSNNNFSGSIPECFGNIGRLQVMKLAKNDLIGPLSLITFPKESCQLQNLDINSNSLGGPLPRSLANCKSIEVLDLGYNKINDSFPTNLLEHLVELQVLILKSNRFSGSLRISNNKSFLPKLLLIDISCNEFSGALPSKLFKSFKAMTSLDKVEPHATGYIGTISPLMNYPYIYSVSLVLKGKFFELVRVLNTFVFIDLSGNNFTGGIPEIIGDLDLLIALNFSHNSFSGQIPSTLGRLHFLKSLDLSCNQIEGEIPWQLADITTLSFLNLSKNHLKGRIPHGKQFNTFLNDSYYGNSELCGFPVTKDCGETKSPLPHSRGSYEDDEDSSFLSAFTWKSVLIGYGFGILLGCLVIFTRKPKCVARTTEELCFCALLLLGKMKKSTRIGGNRHRRNN